MDSRESLWSFANFAVSKTKSRSWILQGFGPSKFFEANTHVHEFADRTRPCQQFSYWIMNLLSLHTQVVLSVLKPSLHYRDRLALKNPQYEHILQQPMSARKRTWYTRGLQNVYPHWWARRFPLEYDGIHHTRIELECPKAFQPLSSPEQVFRTWVGEFSRLQPYVRKR